MELRRRGGLCPDGLRFTGIGENKKIARIEAALVCAWGCVKHFTKSWFSPHGVYRTMKASFYRWENYSTAVKDLV